MLKNDYLDELGRLAEKAKKILQLWLKFTLLQPLLLSEELDAAVQEYVESLVNSTVLMVAAVWIIATVWIIALQS